MFPAFLAGVTEVFGVSLRTAQEGGLLTGAATVLLTGLLGRAIGDRRLGLLSAALVAVSPFLIAVDGSMMSETLYLPLALLALLLAHRARYHSGVVTWLALGAVIGLASLARGDALLLVPFVMLPAAFLSRDALRHLLPRLALGIVALAVVLAPWVIRNSDAVGQATISTISANGVIAAANCKAVYSGPAIGSWSRPCMHESTIGARLTEADFATKLRRQGIDYALDHADRWPVVGAARVGRVWGVWNPSDLTRREAVESRNHRWQWLAWPVSLATLVVGLIGFTVLARQRRPIAVLVGPVAMATFLALAIYGNSRFRTLAEPALLIGTAAALLAFARVVDRRYGSGRVATA